MELAETKDTEVHEVSLEPVVLRVDVEKVEVVDVTEKPDLLVTGDQLVHWEMKERKVTLDLKEREERPVKMEQLDELDLLDKLVQWEYQD